MEWIEIRARSVAEAVERALDALGVHESELEYDVVAQPRSSLFGLRHTDAHIRARVKPLSREKPSERRRRKGRDESRGRGREGGERRPADTRNATGGSGDAPKRGGDSNRGRSGGRGGATAGAPAAAGKAAAPDAAPVAAADAETGAAATVAAPSESGSAGPKRRRRGGRGRSGSNRERPDAPYDDRSDEEITEMPDPAAVEAIAADTRLFVEGLLEAIDLPGRVVITTDEVAVQCSVEGDQLGVLVGAQGATLASIEELLRDAVGHRAPGVRLHLDVAGYRARRRAALAEFAVRVAREVIADGSAKALEPMPAADRKVVHDAIAEVEGVATTSEGEEPRRRVVIKPAG